MLSVLSDILTSEAGLNLIAALVAALWGAYKAWAWRRESNNAALAKVEEIVEAAVHELYETQVRAVKAAGPLTPAKKLELNRLAGLRAIEIGKGVGVDVAKQVGGPLLSLAVEKAVDRRSGKKPPASVQAMLP